MWTQASSPPRASEKGEADWKRRPVDRGSNSLMGVSDLRVATLDFRYCGRFDCRTGIVGHGG